ncbi:unnamed protein product [Brassica oleracea]
MDACLKVDNIDAHFVKGMIQFFQSQNPVLGLHHIHIASKSGHLQGRYIFGVLLMAIGETDKGIKIINDLTEEKELNCHLETERRTRSAQSVSTSFYSPISTR